MTIDQFRSEQIFTYLVVCFADGLVLPGEEDALVEEFAADVALHAAGVEHLLARLDAVPLHRKAARRARVRKPLQQLDRCHYILNFTSSYKAGKNPLLK